MAEVAEGGGGREREASERRGGARGARREARGGRWEAGGGQEGGESAVASDRGADGGRRARAAHAHFWTSRHRQIGHTPAGCALVHGEVGGVCRSRLLVPCVVDSTRPASSALGGSPGRFTPPMREQMHGQRPTRLVCPRVQNQPTPRARRATAKREDNKKNKSADRR